MHEIKVRRADLLGDLKKSAKRAAYLQMGGECWYVLGLDAQGRPIAAANEIPLECGVMVAHSDRFVVARPAPRRPVDRLPFFVWMELARRTPHAIEGGEQAPLADPGDLPGADSGVSSSEAGAPARFGDGL